MTSDLESDLTRPANRTDSIGHGGKREGAGRKPAMPDRIKRTYWLSPRHEAILDRYQRDHDLESRSAALRDLIERADHPAP